MSSKAQSDKKARRPTPRISLVDRLAIASQNLAKLESEAEAGDHLAAHKLETYRYLRAHSRISEDRLFRFLACSSTGIFAVCDDNPMHREFKYRRYCYERFYCYWCMEEIILGLRPDLSPGNEGKKIPSKGGRARKWESMIRSLLRSKTMFLGPAELLSWEITDPTVKKMRSFYRFIEQSWRGKLDKQGRILDGMPWIMPTVFDPIQSEFRSMFIGPPANSRGELFVNSSCKTKNTPLVIPRLPPSRGQLSPWKYRVVKRFHWLERLPRNMTEADYFVKQLQDGLAWVVGSMESWLHMTPAEAYALDQEFHRSKFAKIYGLSDHAVKSAAAEDEPQLIIQMPDGELMDSIDSRKFLGEMVREGSATHIDSTKLGCMECGSSTHDECRSIEE